MERIEIRYEPLLFYIYVFSSFVVISIFKINTDDYFSVILFGIIDLLLIIIHIILRSKVIAVLSEDGLEIPFNKFIRWQEIIGWSYLPGGKISANEIEIKTENEVYRIKGFRALSTVRVFNKYLPGKYNLKSSLIILCAVFIVIVICFCFKVIV